MLVRDVYDSYILKLTENDIAEPRARCSVIFCDVLQMDKARLFAHFDDEISDYHYAQLAIKFNLLLDDVPVQYITGHQEFMSLDFLVTPDVLIPRQDTEILTEAAISAIKDNKIHAPHILELGTGSGCISVSLAHYLPNAAIVASDISEAALSVALKNSARNNVSDQIHFVKGDMLLETFYSKDLRYFIEKDGLFDIVISNPPYIPTAEISYLDKNVRSYEPHTALDGGPDGLNFYRAMIKYSPEILSSSGLILLEAGYDTVHQTAELLNTSFKNIQIIKDISGIDRVIKGNVLK